MRLALLPIVPTPDDASYPELRPTPGEVGAPVFTDWLD
jgi:hypothetical protein